MSCSRTPFFLVVGQLNYEVTHPKSKLLPLVIQYASAVILLKFVVPSSLINF